MKIPCQIRRLPTRAPASALLIPGHDAAALLRICAELRFERLPPVYAVADGFVLLLPTPTDRLFAGVIRLHGLAEHLLMPVDAEMIPPLLPDEMAALVRKRGLVFLPGPRVLEFDVERPIGPAALLRVDRQERGDWRPMPEAATLPETLSEITRATENELPDAIIEQGGDGIGTEAPGLGGGGGVPSKIAAQAMYQLGKGLAWLGNALQMKGLAGLGAKLLGGAMSLVPALSEKLMGQQEAMLRELLRRFRSGDIEAALRRALPLSNEPSRGMAPASDARLPTHNLFYPLMNLLGATGPASYWFSRDNTYFELQKEYRKQADAAAARGDFRRAAFIYGKLLNDFWSAARVLGQGGLHRDAAILYEKKLRNPFEAARQWEAAGEIERALQLYWSLDDRLAAGDLLRRVGEEERAVAEYVFAAEQLIEAGPKYFEAGELMRVRAQRPDLALGYYEIGWRERPEARYLSCGLYLVNHHADAGAIDPFVNVLTEAERFLTEADRDSAATFFTEIARLSRHKSLRPIADELHDRALLGIAKKMKQGESVAPVNLFDSPSAWPVPLSTDAQNALKEARRTERPGRPVYPTLQAGRADVTAACQMPTESMIYLGFENGEVVAYHPATNEAHVLTRESGPVVSLLVDASKTYLVVMSRLNPTKVCVRLVSRTVGYRMINYTHLENESDDPHLALPAVNATPDFVVVCDGPRYSVLRLPNLIGLRGTFSNDDESQGPDIVVCGSRMGPSDQTAWMLALSGPYAELLIDEGDLRRTKQYTPGWVAGNDAERTLLQIPAQAVLMGHGIQVTALAAHGIVKQSTFDFKSALTRPLSYGPIGDDPYLAFATVRADLLAAIHVRGIDWWTPTAKRPRQTKLKLRNPVAAFALPATREVLIVEAHGLLTRVPVTE